MQRFALPALILLGLFLRVAYAAAIYEPSLLPYHYGDFTEYALAAEQIASGDLSFSNSYFVVRPPVFPLLIAALGMSPVLIIAVNIIIAVCIIPATYVVARLCDLSPQLALLAALILALDLTSIKYSGVMLAEPLANFWLALALVCLAAQRRAGLPTSLVMVGGGGVNCAFFINPTSGVSALDADGCLDCRVKKEGENFSGCGVGPASFNRCDRVETAQ